MEKFYTKNAPDAIGPYTQAIKTGSLVFTSGQIAINPATGNVDAQGIQIIALGLSQLPGHIGCPVIVLAPFCRIRRHGPR